MAPSQPGDITLIPRPSSKAAALHAIFPEPLHGHFPLGVTWAPGWDSVSVSTLPHTSSLVWPLSGGARVTFPLISKHEGIVFFISVCSQLAQAWCRVGAKSLLVASIQQCMCESCHTPLLEGLHSFFDGARSQLFCVRVSSVQPEHGSRAKQALPLIIL